MVSKFENIDALPIHNKTTSYILKLYFDQWHLSRIMIHFDCFMSDFERQCKIKWVLLCFQTFYGLSRFMSIIYSRSISF